MKSRVVPRESSLASAKANQQLSRKFFWSAEIGGEGGNGRGRETHSGVSCVLRYGSENWETDQAVQFGVQGSEP